MIASLKRLQKKPISVKAWGWAKLISLTGSTQMIVQATALISGIMIIRMLPTQEYALYTMANSVLGIMTVLSDGGISAGVMAQAGRTWSDRSKLGQVIVTGLALRRKFGSMCLIITLPIAFYLLMHHGASWLTVLLITLSIIPSFFAALSDSLLEIAPKLHQDILPLQKNTIAANVGRLVLIVPAIFFFPWAFVAIICAGLPRTWANIQLRKIVKPYVDWTQQSNQLIKNDIVRTVKRILPEQIYFCFSSQITIWLISIFGSTKSVAQLGALGRLSIMLSLFFGIFQTLIVPRFARLPNERRLVLKWFVLLQVFLFLFLLCITTVMDFFSGSLLWILGKNYAGLENVFGLSVFSAALSAVAGVLYSMLIARNWIMHPALSISAGVITQVILIYLVDFSTISGAYYFSIVQTAVGIVLSYIYVFYYVKRRGIEKESCKI